jgi:two-component system response regulator RegA
MIMPERAPLVYVVDDDEVFRNRLCRALRQRQWNALPAASAEEALSLTRQQLPDLVLLDLRMPGMGGLELIEKLRALNTTMKIIMLTGYGSIPTTITALKRGADDYLSKPADADQIVAAYERLLAPEAKAVEPPAAAPSLARVEWEHMQRVIHDCGGNISQAARVLGIHRRSLQRKLSKYPPPR